MRTLEDTGTQQRRHREVNQFINPLELEPAIDMPRAYLRTCGCLHTQEWGDDIWSLSSQPREEKEKVNKNKNALDRGVVYGRQSGFIYE